EQGAAAVRSLVALLGFGVGLVIGALIVERSADATPWPKAVTQALELEVVILAVFAIGSYLTAVIREVWEAQTLIALSAIAMGIQSAAARRLDVPGIATTYLTGTFTSAVTGLVAKSRRAPRATSTPVPTTASHPWRRQVGLQLFTLVVYGLGALIAGILQAHWSQLVALLPFAVAAAVVLIAPIWIHEHETTQAPHRASKPQIGAPDVLVAQQLLPAPREHHASVLQHVAALREGQGLPRVLLDQQHRRPGAIDLGDDPEDLLHDQWRQPERRLIQHQDARQRHQGPSNREHLLLTTRQRPRGLSAPLTQDRKQRQDTIETLRTLRFRPRGVRAELEVLPNGEARKDLAPLRNLDNTPLHHCVTRQPIRPDVLQQDLACAQTHQARDRPQHGRLPGSVRADDGQDLSRFDRKA